MLHRWRRLRCRRRRPLNSLPALVARTIFGFTLGCLGVLTFIWLSSLATTADGVPSTLLLARQRSDREVDFSRFCFFPSDQSRSLFSLAMSSPSRPRNNEKTKKQQQHTHSSPASASARGPPPRAPAGATAAPTLPSGFCGARTGRTWREGGLPEGFASRSRKQRARARALLLLRRETRIAPLLSALPRSH